VREASGADYLDKLTVGWGIKMLHTQSQEKFGESNSDAAFEARVKLFSATLITAFGLFVGAVIGGVCGLLVYVNSRTPNQHDGVYALIQTVGILVGLAMGYLAARNARAQDDLVEASLKAGSTLLRRYKPKPGSGGQSDVGQRTITSTNAEDFLKTLVVKKK
jgi:hypothetical protein